MKLYLPIFVFSLLSLFSLETKAYAEQDTIIKYTNAVAPEYKVDFAISGDNPNTTFKPNATTAEQASSSNTNAGGTISFPNGKKQEVAETPTSIEDKDGKIYAVGEDGKVTKAAEKTKETESLAGNMSTREKEISEGEVRFSAYKNQSYAFDEYLPIYENVAEYKNKYEEFGEEKVAVKAIATGKPDRVSIAFDGGMPIDSIYFLTPAGVRYRAEKDNGGYYLNLIGGEENAVQEIYAILPNRQDTTKPSTIGKLIVAAYSRQEKNLMLVPVNGAKVDTTGVLKKINEIYNPVNVYWTIKIAENFNNTSWDTDKDGALNVTGSKWYTTYTEEMKVLKTAYSQANNIDQRTLYMFVMKKPKTDNETSSKTIVGDMPRGKQFGFLFTEKADPTTLAKTIAHELGHGYFQLKHPFEMGLKQGGLSTHLMDYAGGTEFNKYEWDLMHDPGIVTGLFQSDTSGQYLANNMIGVLEIIEEDTTTKKKNVIGKIYNITKQEYEDFKNEKGVVYGFMDWFNRNINPVSIISYGTYQTIAGKDLITNKELPRIDGLNVVLEVGMMYTGGKVLEVASKSIYKQVLKKEIVEATANRIPLNRLNHIFGKSEHDLEILVTKFGSQEEAFNAVQKAANQALKSGKLTPNAQGILPSGDLGNIINVGGINVRLIGGRIENGQVIISSFSRKRL